jgi:hypothetical protein
VPTYEVTCAGCGKVFTAKSSRAKWHSPGCKKQAQRNPPAPDVPAPGTPDEHPIVAAVRKELEAGGKAETVDGQAALLLASQAASAGATNVVSLIRQMREVLDAALGRKPGAGDPLEPEEPPAPEPSAADELTKARKSRERKLAQAGEAAGRA